MKPNKLNIPEIIVVEGKDDTKRLKQFDENLDTIETNGSAIDDATLALILCAQKTRGVIVFTDPDAPGEKIRQTIIQAIPDVKQAFLPASSAVPKAKGTLGVEHASNQALKIALRSAYQSNMNPISADPITRSDLLKAQLIVGPNAKKRRIALGDRLHIGKVNGKQLLKRLNAFQISRADFDAAVQQINESESNNQ